MAVAVEKGDESGGGGPELEGEALGGELANEYRGVDGVKGVALLLLVGWL